MKIRRVEVGAYQTNCYMVEQDSTRILIDPGDADGQVLPFLERQSFRPDAILVTHGHQDHYGDVSAIWSFASWTVPMFIPW